MPTALTEYLAALNFSSVIMLGLIAGSGLACLLTVALGRLLRPATTRLPQDFPTDADQCLALVYALIMLCFAASALGGGAGRAATTLSLEAAFFALAWQLGLYLPLLVRYGMLPQRERPPLTWRQRCHWPILALGTIYLAVQGLELVGFYDWLIGVTGCPAQQSSVTQFQQSTDMTLRATITISAVIIAPVTEECCFRGFLYSTLRLWGGRPAAALVSAAVFAAVHASLAQFLPLFLFGLVLCAAYEKARSLWLPIVVHGLFNGLSIINLIVSP